MSAISPVVRRVLDEASRDPVAFWAQAARALPWLRTWDRTFEADPPTFRWFVGAQTNLAHSALDVHVAGGRAGQAALIYFNERGETRVLTYAQLLHEVKRTSRALRALGLERRDRVTIYMPTSPEAIVLMLACVRIGAIHSVVFAGFGARALADRIRASGSRVLFAGDLTYRRGKDVDLTPIVADALQIIDADGGGSLERIVMWRRGPRPSSPFTDAGTGAELSWDAFLQAGDGRDDALAVMEANEPAFILATSGTTAKPKLAVHVHGGYQVHIASMGRWCFGLQPNDVWWSTSDIGWIVGHSYMVYAPLLVGCTSVAYEGALDYPRPESAWKRGIEEFGVTGMFTSPTAIRALMAYGDEPLRGIDHARLERVVCAGEVLNAPAWEWLQRTILGDRVPVIDHMWQTETGGPAFGNPYGLGLLPIRPGSAGIPLPGIEAAVVTLDGAPCATGEKGIMVFTRPFPGMTPALWGEQERYGRDYWERIPGVYYTGDAASFDEDGYAWFSGRADEIIKIAAHRLGTIEVESAVLMHPAVAECGVVGRPDDLRGEVIAAFVKLKQGHAPSPELRREILGVVRRELGPVAVVGDLNFVGLLPKTRSGKIMRRVLKAVILDRDPGDITTIEEEGSVDEARQAWRQMKDDLAAGGE